MLPDGGQIRSIGPKRRQYVLFYSWPDAVWSFPHTGNHTGTGTGKLHYTTDWLGEDLLRMQVLNIGREVKTTLVSHV